MRAQYKAAQKAEDKAELMSDIMGITSVLSAAFPLAGNLVGSTIASSAPEFVQNAIGNAVIGGTTSKLAGGDFLPAAAVSGLGSLAGGYAGTLAPDLARNLGVSEATARVLTSTAAKGALELLRTGEINLETAAMNIATSLGANEIGGAAGINPAEIKKGLDLLMRGIR
jgi:hypothetical protein